MYVSPTDVLQVACTFSAVYTSHKSFCHVARLENANFLYQNKLLNLI